MIDILISDRSIEVSGHSGSAPSGEDLVCAAVSTLTYTLINYIEEHSGIFREKDITDSVPGYAYIVCAPHDDEREKWKVARDLVIIGYEMVAEEFPEYVTVIHI